MLILIVRHAHYYGNDDDDRISDDIGKKDISKVREAFLKFLQEKYSVNFPKRISFSFSSTLRAVRTADELNLGDHDIIVRRHFITNRNDLSEERVNRILAGVIKTAGMYEAEIVVIVAHGDMPPVFAETAHHFVTGKKILLENTMTSCGYVIDMSGPGVIFSVDSRYGLFDVQYKKEEKVILEEVEQLPSDVKKEQSEKKPKPKAKSTDDRDDIPF